MKDHTIKTVMLGAAAAFALLLATAATAGSPGKWSTLATGAGLHSNAQQIALARTPDGTLHVAWKEDTASVDVIHTRSITASGNLGAETTAVSHVPSPSDPALVTTPTGLQLFFAAGAGSPIEGLATSKSAASGTSWSAPVRIVKSSSGLATPAVTLAPDGTSFQAWSGSSIIVHRGLTATAPHLLAVPAGSSNERVNVAADTTGAGIWVAWCRYGGSRTGVIAQRINPTTGGPLGAQIQLPGSLTTYQGQQHTTCVLETTIARREPLVARAGGGVYAAGTAGYPKLTRVLLWRLDAAGVTRKLVAGQATGKFDNGLSDPALAAAPDGRIWVAWIDRRAGGTRIVARHSNRAGTVLGAAVTAAPPGGLLTGAADLSAQSDRADLLVSQQTSSGALRLAHTQLLPGLTLLRGTVVKHGGTALVSVRALDAGDAVAGVRVKIGKASALTKANGSAQIAVKFTSRKHRVTARADRAGYVGAGIRIVVPARPR